MKGTISDASSGEPLPYANIITDKSIGKTATENGRFELSLKPGSHSINFSYLGYLPLTEKLVLREGQTIHLNIRLKASVMELEQTVVSAGRYQQKLSELAISMEILKPALIENTLATSIEQSIERLSGVDIIDGQANIRNGSGWSYGAGSRVLVLVDDIPMLAADAGDAKWNFLPIEEIDQVEVLKGASSALYGSAALNGVIHVRTAWPGAIPTTKVNVFGGIYDKPARDEWLWWSGMNPILGGGSFYHSQRFGNLDLVISGNAFNDPGYREENYEERYRGSLKVRYRDKKIKGLSYSLQSSLMHTDILDFLLWKDADSGALRQSPGTITHNKGLRFYVDPSIVYYNPNGGKHQLKARYFHTRNSFPFDPAKDNEADWHFSEYQYYRNFNESFNLTAGASTSYTHSNAALFGDHTMYQMAIFTQGEKRWGKLSLSLGARWELNQLDTAPAESRPVFRAGANYALAKYTFLRTSFGQGYRYPSIAEKHTLTSVGGLNIFPNPRIGSESGWSAEAGIKQGFKLGSWEGIVDLAGFWTEYQNMMEFFFGFYDTLTYLPINENLTIQNAGFQARNIGKARISGIEVVLAAKGNIQKMPVQLMLGYTYTYPIDLNEDSIYRAGKATDDNILKYRYFHSLKGDIQLSKAKATLGFSLRYTSFLANIDRVFVDPFLGELILPGYPGYREDHFNEGNLVVDFRFSYQILHSLKASMVINNLLNHENIGRPGDILPPRHILLRLDYRI